MTRHQSLLLRVRRLSQALAVSGSVNILLAALFIYWNVQERPPTPYCTHKPASSEPLPIALTNNNALKRLDALSFHDLVTKLQSREPVENGYLECHLAVGMLVSFYNFDIDKALAGLQRPQEVRTLLFKNRQGEEKRLTLFASLSDRQLQAIEEYAVRERWPLTSEGLFYKLQEKEAMSHDPSLAETFYLTSEFLSAERLLNRNKTMKKEELLHLLLEGSWDSIAVFTKEQRGVQDLSESRRRSFLLHYIEQGSKCAARTLLNNDSAFAIKSLSDSEALQLLKLCQEKTKEAAHYALAMLISPRSDKVWEEAARRLYTFVGEEAPPIFDRNSVISRFIPVAATKKLPESTQLVAATKKAAPTQEVSKKAGKRAYIVQEGDSLWKISRRYHVKIETIKQLNSLKSDHLQPGTLLMLP